MRPSAAPACPSPARTVTRSRQWYAEPRPTLLSTRLINQTGRRPMPRVHLLPPRPLPKRLFHARRPQQGRHRHLVHHRAVRHRVAHHPQEQGRHLQVLVQHASHELERGRIQARGVHRRRRDVEGDEPPVVQLLREQQRFWDGYSGCQGHQRGRADHCREWRECCVEHDEDGEQQLLRLSGADGQAAGIFALMARWTLMMAPMTIF